MSAPPGGGGSAVPALSQTDSLNQLVNFPTSELVAVLAPLLEQLMERNDKLPLQELTSFHARSRPPLSIYSYLMRFVQYAPMANECYILMLIYLDRISQTNSAFCITALNAHRMIVTGLVLAAKFSQDRYYTNTHYARVGGLPVRELKALELEFLARIYYTLWADAGVIEAYWTQLLQHARRNNLLSDTAKTALLLTQPIDAGDERAAKSGSMRAEHTPSQNASAAPNPPKRQKLGSTAGLDGVQAESEGDAAVNYTDEYMRYELLRRQQERLRQAQPAPQAQAHSQTWPIRPPQHPPYSAPAAQPVPHPPGQFPSAHTMQNTQLSNPQNLAATHMVGGSSPHPQHLAMGQASHAGLSSQQTPSALAPQYTRTHAFSPEQLVPLHSGGVHGGRTALSHSAGGFVGAHHHGAHNSAALGIQPQPQGYNQQSGASTAHHPAVQYAATGMPMTVPHYPQAHSVQPNPQHLSPTQHLSPHQLRMSSQSSQGASSRSNSLTTSISSTSLEVSPPQHATTHVYRHLHRQSSAKSPYHPPARSPKVTATSPLALTPRGSSGNPPPPLSVTPSVAEGSHYSANEITPMSPAGQETRPPSAQEYTATAHVSNSAAAAGTALDSVAGQYQYTNPGSAADTAMAEGTHTPSPRAGPTGSPCNISPATSANQSPVVMASV